MMYKMLYNDSITTTYIYRFDERKTVWEEKRDDKSTWPGR